MTQLLVTELPNFIEIFDISCTGAPLAQMTIERVDKHIDKKGLPCHGPQNKKVAGTRGLKVQPVTPFFIRFMSTTRSSLLVGKQVVPENTVQQTELLDASNDAYGGVIVDMKEHVDPNVFVTLLRASMSQWAQQIVDLGL
ncbi:hypothetical protein F0562_006442 [Nyssa sinensis]|uniref:Pre-nudix hydrolase domain-containing protein n=1 Tax=Nyssa sinensis TaxID=561372 RepID=A0A5J5AS23_9ASTE|nr:hypothetical protein F0562_006442 [Nyssa sinensis]